MANCMQTFVLLPKILKLIKTNIFYNIAWKPGSLKSSHMCSLGSMVSCLYIKGNYACNQLA